MRGAETFARSLSAQATTAQLLRDGEKHGWPAEVPCVGRKEVVEMTSASIKLLFETLLTWAP